MRLPQSRESSLGDVKLPLARKLHGTASFLMMNYIHLYMIIMNLLFLANNNI
jgi:hypothetical protein